MDLLLETIPPWLWMVAAGVFGALWGSFANVVIVRWPLELSIVRPGSHCTACKQPVRFYDNIPVVSYLLLRGRCRDCGTSFSPRYMVVELVMGLLAAGVCRITLLADPPSLLIGAGAFFVWFAFVWGLVTAGLIDLETYLLPDSITLPGIVIGLAANAFVLRTGWIDPLVGAACGYAGLSLLFVHGYRLLTGKQGMGEGDPKLLAAIGAFVGWQGALFAVFAGSVQGLFVGGALAIHRRRTGTEPPLPGEDEPLEEGEDPAPELAGGPDDPRLMKLRVPFGPFLALGALEYLFFGPSLIAMYGGTIDALAAAVFGSF